MTAAVVAGYVLGLSIAAPVGPVGVLCIRRTLAHGHLYGLVSGLGAATADACFGLLAALGLSALPALLSGVRLPLRLVGGAFLCYLGVATFLARPSAAAAQGGDPPRLMGAYVSTLALTLTNPMTILMFASMLAGLGFASRGYALALVFVAGVFLGSASWWLLLSSGVGLVRSRLDERHMRWVNRASGLVILAFGIASVGSALVALP